MDHLLTPSFFVDKFYETFDEPVFIIQCLRNYLASFLLVKFSIEVVVKIIPGIEVRKVSGANFFRQNYDRRNFSTVSSLTTDPGVGVWWKQN